VGITAHDATISLRIIAHGLNPDECQRKIDAATRTIQERLGHYVFGRDLEEPEHVVVRELQGRGATLGTCEAATGGNLVSRILAVPDGSAVSRGGLVLATHADAARLLHVEVSDGRLTTSPSGHELARELAIAARRMLATGYALAVTPWGSLPLDNGSPPVPTAWVALADGEGVWSEEARQTGNPAIFAARTAKIALDLLRRRLQGLPLPA
jgi:nicotinamide-nucleotide amidase